MATLLQIDYNTQIKNEPNPSPENYNWSQINGSGAFGNLASPGGHTVTVTPIPAGVSAASIGVSYVRISGGVGTAEVALVTSFSSGSGSCTIGLTTVNSHTGAWIIGSATGGMQEAILSIGAGGGIGIQHPVNTYATTLIPYSFSVTGRGPQATIFAHGVVGQTVNIFQAIGALLTGVNITVSINSDPTTSSSANVTVADSSGFSAGDYVLLTGQQNDFSNTYGQTTVVLTSVAGVITTKDRVLIRINTADNVHTIQKIGPVQSVLIEGLVFDGANASTADTSRGIIFNATANCTVRSCKFQNFITSPVGAAGFYASVAYNLTADSLEYFNCGNANESDHNMSAISFSQQSNIRSFSANGFGPQWQYGVGLIIRGVISSSAFDRGMKLAGIGRSVISGLQIDSPRTAAEGVCLALAWRCFSLDISGVQLEGATAVYGSLWLQDAQSVTIRGVQIIGSAGSGIQFETAGGTSLGAVNCTISELITPDLITYNAPASANNFIKWASKYRSKAWSSLGTIISAANNTWTSIPFDTNDYDVGGIHSTSVNTSRFTAPVTGLYRFTAPVTFAGSAAGTLRDVRFFGNGASTLLFVQGFPNAIAQTITASTSLQMNAGDFIEVQVIQDSGGTLGITGGFEYFTSVIVEIVQ